jgi:putative methyltransferase (TIGR04325 family)
LCASMFNQVVKSLRIAGLPSEWRRRIGQLILGSPTNITSFGISFELIPAWPDETDKPSWGAPSVTERFRKDAESIDLNLTMQYLETTFKSPIYRENIEVLSRTGLTNAALLDFGCGNGIYRSILAAHPATTSWKYVGADLNTELVRFCRMKYPDTRFEFVDKADMLPFKDREFDVVFASGVIQYIKDYTSVVSELRRITGYYLAITRLPLWKYNETQIALQNVHHQWGEEHHPIYVFNRNAIEALFSRLGFSTLWHDYGSEVFHVTSVAEPVVSNTYLLRKNRA